MQRGTVLWSLSLSSVLSHSYIWTEKHSKQSKAQRQKRTFTLWASTWDMQQDGPEHKRNWRCILKGQPQKKEDNSVIINLCLRQYRHASSFIQIDNISFWLKLLNYSPDGGNGNLIHCKNENAISKQWNCGNRLQAILLIKLNKLELSNNLSNKFFKVQMIVTKYTVKMNMLI